MGIDSKPREMEPVHREIFHFAIATGNIGEKSGRTRQFLHKE
jgi:hypothetical protein